jgi:hypothetical protein
MPPNRSIAAPGDKTSIPNRAVASRKSRRLNVTIASARPFTATSRILPAILQSGDHFSEFVFSHATASYSAYEAGAIKFGFVSPNCIKLSLRFYSYRLTNKKGAI